MVHNGILGDFDTTIKFSIAAMAEIISMAAHYATTKPRFKELVGGANIGSFVFGRYHSYLDAKGNVVARMVQAGWCPSDIEKLRRTYGGLGTLHYISGLSRPEARDHSSCNETSCTSYQIDLTTYQLSHAATGCTCPEFEVNIADVQKVLRNTTTFPVLRFSRTDKGVDLVVQEYQEGTEYVALSHVRIFHTFRQSTDS